MIENYADHSANERTFLAWVRTAVAIVGFGVLVERLNQGPTPHNGISFTGTILLISGMLMILGAGSRFLITRRLIRSRSVRSAAPITLDIALAIVLLVMIATLTSFGAHVIQSL